MWCRSHLYFFFIFKIPQMFCRLSNVFVYTVAFLKLEWTKVHKRAKIGYFENLLLVGRRTFDFQTLPRHLKLLLLISTSYWTFILPLKQFNRCENSWFSVVILWFYWSYLIGRVDLWLCCRAAARFCCTVMSHYCGDAPAHNRRFPSTSKDTVSAHDQPISPPQINVTCPHCQVA